MFTTLIVQPIFNLLVFICAIIPGHNFGVAIIIFTILVRLALWPLVKKQLHHAKAMRALQPEIRKIKAAAKGDRQKVSRLTMELYKERQINPFSSIGIVIVQLPIFIGLYSGLKKIIDHPQQIIDFSYPFLHNLSWMKSLTVDIHRFDESLLGFVDLTRAAIGPHGGIYWPAMVLVLASAIAQYIQSKQLLPNDKDARPLRSILKDARGGKSADQDEVSQAVGRFTLFLIPGFIFLVTVRLASALSLYWFVSALVAIVQQSIVLKDDAQEMESVTVTRKSVDEIPEAEVVDTSAKKTKKPKASAKRKRKKR